MMEYKTIEEEFELDAKRFHIPVIIHVECPKCHITHSLDLKDSYLNYPTLNKKEAFHSYCDDCNTEFEFDITLKISLDIDTETRKL